MYALLVVIHAVGVWKSTMMDSGEQFVMTFLISMMLRSSVANWATIELLQHMEELVMVKALYQYCWMTCNALVVKIKLVSVVVLDGVCIAATTVKMPVLYVHVSIL